MLSNQAYVVVKFIVTDSSNGNQLGVAFPGHMQWATTGPSNLAIFF